MVRPDQSARDIATYFNEDPLDLSTGGKITLNLLILVKDQNTLYLILGAVQKTHGVMSS
jgi:hypothetical protein